ncbi:DDE-type integrase/transposase/recombinase [Rhizobium leguminosarum bv. viciae]|uniref:integrase catalytic domain-containing protein n=1 Tax=Rhizobium leguminosarum TaxID=384 RepID=UPI0014419398|nr:DDE-type integrase/transposase/recombinase [Rhizobium leguminosarum]NKL74262.1 DDE-type integrase/transposase/recombinase [Rhizobium leguminosarum bv. viciae]
MFEAPFNIGFLRLDLRSDDRVIFSDGMTCRPKETDDNGHFFNPVDDLNYTKFVSHADYYLGIVAGEIRVEEDYFSVKKTQLREMWGDLTIKQLTPDGRARVYRSKGFIDRYDNLIQSTAVRITAKMLQALLKKWNAELNEEAREKQQTAEEEQPKRDKKKTDRPRSHKRTTYSVFEKAPSVETFFEQYNRYYYFDKNLVALARKPNKPGCTRNRQHHSPESLAFAIAWADRHYVADRSKKKTLYEEYVGAVASNPLLTKVTYDAFDGMIMSGATYDRVFARYGAAKARKMFRPLRHGTDVTRVGELVAFDDHECDLAVWLRVFGVWDHLTPYMKKVAETSRVWITVGVDLATGYIVAIRMSKKRSSKMVVGAIEMAISDKTHIAQMCGARRPWFPFPIDNFISDNGAEYTADEVTEILNACGIEPDRTPAEQPWLRGTCERTLRTLGALVTHGMPGRTFSNVVERGDYKSEENAALLAEEFYALLIRMTVDYHHLKISGPRKRSPHNAVAQYLSEMAPGSRRIIDLHMRRHIFGIDQKHVIHPEGIIVWGIRYNSDDLQMHRQHVGNKKVRIRIHEEDLRWISVQLRDRKWITVRNRFDFDGPVGLKEWILARRDVLADAKEEEKNDLEVQWAALAHRREIGDSAILAAGITMHRPTHNDYRQHHKIMFENASYQKKRPLAALPIPFIEKEKLLQNGFKAIKGENLAPPMAEKNTNASAKKKVTPPKKKEIDGYDAY